MVRSSYIGADLGRKLAHSPACPSCGSYLLEAAVDLHGEGTRPGYSRHATDLVLSSRDLQF
jgi:hypothetical protein